ncbi:hypothetical protein GDO81_022925 [Engystomops pustulosus]|uniref:Uncharacterized protein n=1 Tax=Engystomops pustulosus TaxID=76066 RepID=A0AAV6YM92_ENGPU|nr:hypothetical protein GDO81_022925 [Engystomops pustulosus]
MYPQLHDPPTPSQPKTTPYPYPSKDGRQQVTANHHWCPPADVIHHFSSGANKLRHRGIVTSTIAASLSSYHTALMIMSYHANSG